MQFALIARANTWDDATKAGALASCLRGEARSVLESLEDVETFGYLDLKSKLEVCFGEVVSAQGYYLRFTNGRQKAGEEYAMLGADLERLARQAYPDCSVAVRSKIACFQFVAALTDGYVKRTLQQEGVITLRVAVERAKKIKIINKNSFPGKGDAEKTVKNTVGKEKNSRLNKNANGERKGAAGECWQCGAKAHFRATCPSLMKEN